MQCDPQQECVARTLPGCRKHEELNERHPHHPCKQRQAVAPDGQPRKQQRPATVALKPALRPLELDVTDREPGTTLEMQEVAADEPVADGAQGVSETRCGPQSQGIAAGREEPKQQDFRVKRKERRGQECRAEQRQIGSEQVLPGRLKLYAG